MSATLASRIASADAAYRRGQAHMTDQEFDALMAKLRATQPDHPMLRMPGGGDKLLSLGNYDLDDWLADIGPAATGRFTITPKVDGCALALRYFDGVLREAWTRSGKYALHVAVLVESIPLIMSSKGVFEMRGELYGFDHKQSTPAAALRRRVASGDGLGFIAFEVMSAPELAHSEQLRQLDDLGFDAATRLITSDHEQLRDAHARWKAGDAWPHLPTDGIVINVDDPAQRQRLGSSSVAPRYALAMK